MKKATTLALPAIALLLASCASPIERYAVSKRDFAREDVLKIDQHTVKRRKAMLPYSNSCTDTPLVEIKRITSTPTLVEDRYIVTHPGCNSTNVYYFSVQEIKPGAYMTSTGTGMRTDLTKSGN
ncbi:MAG: hypothetical protein EOP88_20720 [Verrucomicrobiaceae bacterium]|nr:MAG: hypothetical protein EOP88_20720 [Verrucomicrobiaceae bacterium]